MKSWLQRRQGGEPPELTRCSKYSHPSFRQKNVPENVRAHKLSRIKGVLSPSHLADRPSSDSNLSQTSPTSIKKTLASVEWLDALDTLMPPALTHGSPR